MCGRTACVLDEGTICKRCTITNNSSNRSIHPKWSAPTDGHKYQPSYNQAPGSYTPILFMPKEGVEKNADALVQPMLWGLVPHFVKNNDTAKSYATSNARIESLLQKPTYGNSMRKGWRCIVLAQGFYEWKTVNGKKQPYYIYMSDPEKLLTMAGVYSYNQGKKLFSYSVITANSIGPMAKVHHRMPVILSTDEEIFTWLDVQSVDSNQAYNFLVQVAKNLETVPLSMHMVTPRMNSTRYNEPDCILPLGTADDVKKTATLAGNADMMTAFLKRGAVKSDNDRSEPPLKKMDESVHLSSRISTRSSWVKKEEPAGKKEEP